MPAPSKKVYFVWQYWMPVAYFVHLFMTGQHPPRLPVAVNDPTR